MIFGIFLKDPFYLYYNSAGRKTLFFIFLTFKDLRELKRTWDFFYAILLRRMKSWITWASPEAEGGPREGPPCGLIPWPHEWGLLPPRGSDAVRLRVDLFVLT